MEMGYAIRLRLPVVGMFREHATTIQRRRIQVSAITLRPTLIAMETP